ncbi:hypothetical protein [Lachnospira multipara]|uniref:hypothetical protein n=1 Tax=Lachnospira multipara TaxID=28051 RepID=UPI0004185EE8|nr:hypothetical protein [Lachnospira multipara]
MRKVNLKFKRLICFFIAIILLFCLDKNNYLHQVKADNETHVFNISPVGKIYTITEKFDNTYSIPDNNYTLDLSNTSRNSPAEITEFIYQTKLKIEPNTTNNATITNIEALDVNEKAVTITSSTDNDNSYTLEFNSFFYDNVVFEITDSENEKYYLKINRYAAIISTNFDNIDDPTPTTKKVFANLYLDEKEEAGSEVVNLTTLIKKVYNDNSYDFDYASVELNGSQNLVITTNTYRACQFSTEVDSNVKEVYFITTRPHWTSKTNGIITGSGMGVKYDISTKKTTY